MSTSRQPIPVRERLRIVVGALVGVALVALLTAAAERVLGVAALPWLVAPIGASAVIVFALPSSPLGQPWPVIGGNLLGALAGIACARWLDPGWIAAGAAVAIAMALMMLTRSLHPPGGAAALLAALTQTTQWQFAVVPVALNSALLVVAALVWHRITRRPGRRLSDAPSTPDKAAIDAAIDHVVARYGEVLDVDSSTLRALLADAQTEAYRRRLDAISCASIMHRDVITLRADDSVAHARQLLETHGVKAMPVVDAHRHVVGIVTGADVLPSSSRNALRTDADWIASRMTRRVRVISADRHLADLIPLFASSGHHHIPVIDADKRLVGMITQRDVMQALHRPQASADRLVTP